MLVELASQYHSLLGDEKPLQRFKRLAIAAGATWYPYADEAYYNLHKLARNRSTLLLFPAAYKTSNLYAMKGDGQLYTIPFSRTGTATRINASGVMEVVSNNVPRLTYDAVTLKAKGYLIEQASTNYNTNADNTTGWGINSNVTISAVSGSLLPSGSAVKIVPNTTASQHGVFKHTLSLFPAAGSVVSFSVFLKADGYAGCLVIFRDRNNATSRAANVNLNTGVIVAHNATGAESFILENFANGWYRLKLENWTTSMTTAGNATQEIYTCPVGMLDSSLNAKSFAGDGVSGMQFTGLQIEVSSRVTSYIPTAGSQVTRISDSITFDGLNTSGILGAQEGTVIFQGTANGNMLSALNASATDLYTFASSELYNVSENVHTTDSQRILTKGGWRWQINGKDTFAHDGTVYENVATTANGYAVNKVTAPNSPILLKSLAMFNTAMSNADMSTITT